MLNRPSGECHCFIDGRITRPGGEVLGDGEGGVSQANQSHSSQGYSMVHLVL